jgi:ubiquinone/menaquinone biosynthesis C-methylase UbiE
MPAAVNATRFDTAADDVFIGWIVTGGDASAYRYLLCGVREFPTAEELAEELRHLGFEEVAFERLSLGIVAIHLARKATDSINSPNMAI